MSHPIEPVEPRWRRRLRGVAVLLAAGSTALPLLLAAGGTAQEPAPEPAASPAATGVDAVLALARAQVGDPYQWGGNGPDAWDCSGLTSYMWREVGGVEDIPRVSRDQFAWAVPIPREQLIPGDLVFWGNPVSHVALYAGMGKVLSASSAAGAVVERPIWWTDLVRFGRVPRAGMPRVTPWTPPPPPPAPVTAPVTGPVAGPVSGRVAGRVAAPVAEPFPPSAARPALTARLVPLRGLPARNLPAASAVAARAVRNAASVRGSRHWSDVSLVRVAWHHAGGQVLPRSAGGIAAAGRPVPVGQVRVGDLVVYGAPASHVGLYLGHGYMVDASPSLRRVVVRRVFVSPTVRFVRLPAR